MPLTAEQVRTVSIDPPPTAELGSPTVNLFQARESRHEKSPQILLPTPEQFTSVANALSEPGKPIDQKALSSVLCFFDLAARPLSLHPARQHILQAMNCLAWARAIRTQTWVREPTTYPVGVQLRALTLSRDTIATLGQEVKTADNHGARQETINLLTMLSLLSLPAQHQVITANEIGNHEIGAFLWGIARIMSEDLLPQNSKDTYFSFWDYCQKSALSVNHLVETALSQN
jgi:hypothetical protein